ncbi:hypothetical protein ACFFLS_04885 [Flavobacterium procerum]|uniref:VanZ-like domain-containing protein n=1 Tax=Flavobacterium procerum TaxID=1455569 RepID=A0ABV6BQN9_9FLAO
MTRNLSRLGQPVFIFSLIILVLNDWLLKSIFHNFITGKLSDFTGLFAFPFFWSVLFPKRIKEIHLGTLLFFIFWKSPLSETFVHFIGASRIVDFSDNMALISIFISFQILKKESYVLKLHPFFLQLIVLLSCFSFIATTQKREPCTSIECEFSTLSLSNETNQKIIVQIDFTYSEKEIAFYKKQQILQRINNVRKILEERHERKTSPGFQPSDSIEIVKMINENWSNRKKISLINPLVLNVHESKSVAIPLWQFDSLVGFPENFKISVLDTTKKIIKTYNKKAFFEKINQNSSVKLNEFSRDDQLDLTFGEVKKPFVLSDCYGKWESKTTGTFSKIEFNSKYFSNDKTGDVFDCEYQSDTILVYTPEKVHIGIMKKTKDDVLVISWSTEKTLTYKKSSKPRTLGNQ